MTNWLRRQTTYPGGIAAGGGDTGYDAFPQPVRLVKRVTNTATVVYLPKGTIMLATVLMPDHENPCTTGDWAIVDDTNSNTDLAASAAETPLVTAYSPLKRLTARTQYTLTPTNSPDGVTYVGFDVILPKMRP